MSRTDFFNEMSDRSKIKVEIVRKYFWRWAKEMSKHALKKHNPRIAYADLFAGKGRYDDGTPSTPILILQSAISDPTLRKILVSFFNDSNKTYVKDLQREIDQIPSIESMAYKPIVWNHEVDDTLGKRFENWSIPTLFFLDPCGYKGLSIRLIKTVLRSWGSDCIFFFNYNRINHHLSNPVFDENMNQFFGVERANRLRAKLRGMKPNERQSIIIIELKQALSELGGKYSVEYRFKDDSGNKTSHFLIFVSKHPLGEKFMKDVMAEESPAMPHGVPSFIYNPLYDEKQGTLFSPLDDLAEMLLHDFAGQTLTTDEIYKAHNIGKKYIFKNYQDAPEAVGVSR